MADNNTRIIISAEDRTGNAINSAKSGISSLSDSYGKLAGLTSLIAGSGIVALVKSTIDAADEMNKLSQKTGITVEALSALKYAGDLSDVSLEALSSGFKKLSVNMNAAASDAKGEAAAAFRAIGISVKDSTGALRGADAVFADVADSFAGMKDGAGKAALAVALFGKSGADMIPLLNQGSSGLGDMRAEAERLGLVMSSDLAKSSEEFNDNLTRLKTTASAAGISIATGLMPSLSDTAEAMVRLQKEGHGVLALLRGFAGLGKLPFDLAFGQADMSVGAQVKQLKQDLADMQRHLPDVEQGGALQRWMYGSKDELTRKIEVTKNQIAALEKYADKIRPAQASKPEKALDSAPVFGTAKGVSAGKKPVSAIDVFDNMSFITHDKAVAEFIREQQKAVNDLSAAMVSDGVKAAEEYQRALNGLVSDTPIMKTEELMGNLALLDDAFMTGKISADVHGQAIDKLTGSMDGLKETGKDTFDELKQAIEGWGKQSADAMVEFALTGKTSFSDMTTSILADIAKMLAYKNITQPLFDSISSFDFSSFFQANALGGVYESPSLSAYSGGVYDSPKAFAFASGAGIFAEAGPEAIMPLARGADGKLGVQAQGVGSNVIINVVEAPGKGGQQQARSEGGTRIIDIFVEQVKSAIAGDIARGSGAIPAALSGTYGLNRAPGMY